MPLPLSDNDKIVTRNVLALFTALGAILITAIVSYLTFSLGNQRSVSRVLANCSVGNTNLYPGDALIVSGNGFTGQRLPISLLGGFDATAIPIGNLENIGSSYSSIVETPEVPPGIYQARIHTIGGLVVDCTPQITINSLIPTPQPQSSPSSNLKNR